MAVITEIINVNSSFELYSSDLFMKNGIVKVWIYSGQQGLPSPLDVPITSDSNDRPFTPTYILSSSAVSLIENEPDILTINFSVSELIKDFIISELGKDYSVGGNTVWVDYQFQNFYNNGTNKYLPAVQCIAVDGYEYTIDNKSDKENILRISNRHIVKNISESIKVPVLRKGMISYAFEKDGAIISSGTTSDFNDSEYLDDQVVYLSNIASNVDSFRDRVLVDSTGVFESSECLKQFEYEFTPFAVDKLNITYEYFEPTGDNIKTDVITIENVDECKYNPVQVTFINKFGAYQSIWFFKNSRRVMNVSSDNWNRRVGIVAGVGIKRTTVKHNTQIKEKITLNSGFYPENNNVLFEELIQSDTVWIWTNPKDNITASEPIPVNVLSSSLEFKNSITDQTINYAIEFEYAISKIKGI